MTDISIVERARRFASRLAITSESTGFTYSDLLNRSAEVATGLLDGRANLKEARVAFLMPSGFDYVGTQWGVWRAGGVAVPLCVSHPRPEVEYVLTDTQADTVIAHPEFEDFLRPIAGDLGLRFRTLTQLGDCPPAELPAIDEDQRAMILYTSGTTGKPKGVVTTHLIIRAQIETLVQAWAWTSEDRIIGFLPLHHIHGLINVLGCALWSGAVCDMMPGFDAERVWQRTVETDSTLFMAVPAVYARLAASWDAASREEQQRRSASCKKLRLMVSGSAALPVKMLERWEAISGHRLLERYGMTEIGMALSNPYEGERLPGRVGRPLPGVEARLMDEANHVIDEETDAESDTEVPGEIQIKSHSVFKEYWRRPEETSKGFTGGWFMTGDIATRTDGVYRILGRSSVDIIKTGGYKVSALEIEEVLRTHDAIADCAVVGIEDDQWGERVSAVWVVTDGHSAETAALQDWCKERLAPYKVPRQFEMVADLPRNVIGKVTKPDVSKLLSSLWKEPPG